MPITEVFQKCAGGCGAERELSSNELVLWNLHGPLKWWCQPCVEKIEAEKLWTPIVEALEKCPTLRAKLRRLILVEDE